MLTSFLGSAHPEPTLFLLWPRASVGSGQNGWDSTFTSWPQPLPLPSSLSSCARQAPHHLPQSLSSTVHLWVFPTYMCLQPMTQILTTLPCRKPLSGGPGLSAFFFLVLHFLPTSRTIRVDSLCWVSGPAWLNGRKYPGMLLAWRFCFSCSIKPRARESQPRSWEGTKRQPCAVAPWNDPGHWSEMDPGRETSPTTQQPCDLEQVTSWASTF